MSRRIGNSQQPHPKSNAGKWILPLPFQRTSSKVFMALSTSEVMYAILSLSLVVLVFFIITFIDSSTMSTTKAPPMRTTEDNVFESKMSAVGSAKQLQYLVQNITAQAHNQAPKHTHYIPTASLVVAVAVNYAYRKLALNFICNLNRLNISNYVVLAMDRPVFHYLSQRNAHVFFHDLSYQHHHHTTTTRRRRRRLLSSNPFPSSTFKQSIVGNDTPHTFGTSDFIETSRRKSLLVLRLLTLGYSVIFSDVDVIWVSNPIPSMLSYSANFVIQSDTSYALYDAPLNHNLNSGLYLARAAPQTIIAMRAIIKYAYAIRRSEQKAFNHVLCGAFKNHHGGPGNRVGSTECFYSNAGTTTKVLPLHNFPNGSQQSLWMKCSDFSRQHPNVIALHANYVERREEKEKRIQTIGFWFHSEQSTSRNECILPPSQSS